MNAHAHAHAHINITDDIARVALAVAQKQSRFGDVAGALVRYQETRGGDVEPVFTQPDIDLVERYHVPLYITFDGQLRVLRPGHINSRTTISDGELVRVAYGEAVR